MRHKCLASFIVVVLYFTITATIVLAEIKVLTRPQIIAKTLSQSGIYNNLPKYVDSFFSSNQKMNFQSKALVKTIAQSINPQNLQAEVEKNIGPFSDYLNGKTALPNVSFDLRELKQNIKTNLPEILAQEAAELKPCAPGIETSPESEEMSSCLPQGTTPEQVKEQALNTGSVSELVGQIPDTYSLNTLKNPEKTFAVAKLAFKSINIGFYVSIISSLLLIVFLVLLGLSFWPSIPRWVGLSLVLPSGSLLLANVFSNFLPKILTNQLSQNMDEQIINLLNPVILAVNNNTLSISYLYAGAVFGLGALLIILSYVLPHPPEPKPPAKAPTPQPTPNKS